MKSTQNTTAKEFVKSHFPNAYCMQVNGHGVYCNIVSGLIIIGQADTQANAWQDAKDRIEAPDVKDVPIKQT
jgi:hypothetical protein